MLTISSTTAPATDLGYLLHKNPARVHEREVSFGVARVVFPEATEERCTAALLLDLDTVRLVRGPAGGGGRSHGKGGPRGGRGFSLADYVNDRPYVASSFLAVALNRMFGTAMTGRSKERPELAETPLPFEVHIPVLPCRGGDDLLERLLGPLGYEVEATPLPLDPTFPEWGDSRYVDLRMQGKVRLRDLLEHLFVLLPVLDGDKHYWVGEDEVDKLLRRSGDWLAAHPDRELITGRYLRHADRLTRDALARLVEADGTVGDPDADLQRGDDEEAAVEKPVRLNDQRIAAVVGALESAGSRSIVDLGCGQGTLLQALVGQPWVDRLVGVDVSWRALEVAARRLRLHQLPPRRRERIELLQGALTYRDKRLRGFDAATVVEVIEHIDPPRLPAFERALFGDARPVTVVVTTPNVEYNSRFEGLAAGQLRHRDHRFEWTRNEFGRWAQRVAAGHGYTVLIAPIGPVADSLGAPTQMALFRRDEPATTAAAREAQGAA